MSERSHVQITIRTSDYEKHKEFFGHDKLTSKAGGACADSFSFNENSVMMEAQDMKAAEWPEIESFLTKHKIEFDKWWSDTGDYEAGTEYYRWIQKGKKKVYTSYESYDSNVTQLELLRDILSMLEADPAKAIKELRKRVKKLHPWDAVNLDVPIPNSVKFIKEA